MNTTVKERLLQFIKYKGLKVSGFERQCGFSVGYVANMRVSMQPDKVMSISQNFPELNTGWLLTGEGEMLKVTKTETPTIQSPTDWEAIIKEKERIITEQANHINTLKQSLNMNEKVIDVMSETLKRTISGESLLPKSHEVG